MTKCRKIKNPCKVCLNQVTTKNGFQCQGVCGEWVHFTCMEHSTPGRINDMKAGRLKVYCPCPDCKAKNITREIYVDNTKFTCNRPTCPAKHAPICGNENCPGAKKKIQPCGSDCPELDEAGASLQKQTAGDSVRAYSSNTNVGGDIEQICMAVGQLTQQINKLMTRLKCGGGYDEGECGSRAANSDTDIVSTKKRSMCGKKCCRNK